MKRRIFRLSLLGVLIWMLALTGCSQGEGETGVRDLAAGPTSTAAPEATREPAREIKRPKPTKTEGPENFRAFENNPYYRDWNLDIYLPLDGDPPYPVLAIFQNFAYTNKVYADAGKYIAGEGYAVVVVDYDYARWERTAPCALAWVQANRSKFGFDPGNIAIFGDGWGAWPAAWLGTVDDPAQYMEACDYPLMDPGAVKGVIIWAGFGPGGPLCSSSGSAFGVPEDWREEVCNELEDTPPEEWLDLADAYNEGNAMYIHFLPMAWQDPADPPILLLDFEKNLNIRYSEDYASAVQALGGRIDFITIPDGKAGTLQDADTPDFMAVWGAMQPFLAQIFE